LIKAKFLKDFFGYGLGMAVSKMLTLVSYPLYARFYSASDLGVLELALSLMGFFLIFCLLGADTALTFYYWDNKNNENRKSYFTSAFSIILFISTVVFFGLFLFEEYVRDIYFKGNFKFDYFGFSILVFSQTFFVFLNKYFRIHGNVKGYNLILIANACLFILFIFLLIKYENINAFFYAKLISIIPLVFLMVLIFKKSFSKFPKLEYVKNILNYSIPLIPFSLVLAMVAAIDKLSINYFLTLSDVGVFSVGAKGGLFVGLFTTAFSMAFAPYAMSIKNKSNCREIYASIFEIYLICILGCVLLIVSIDDFILRYFVGDNIDYIEAKKIIGLSALSFSLNSMFSQLGIGLNILSKNKYFFHGAVASLFLNILLNIIFIPIFGINGAAYSGILSYLSITVWIYFVNQKFYPIPYGKKNILIILLFLFCFFIIYNLILDDNIFLKTLVLIFYFFIGVLISSKRFLKNDR